MNAFPGYDEEHEETMLLYYLSLPEDHRRRYAAVEALKIEFGGVAYIARVLEMSRSTIYAGIYELQAMRTENGDPPQRPSGDSTRIRRPGGGRRPEVECQAGLPETFEKVLEAHSAGSPTDKSLR